jgi:hypothetical protein
VPKGEQFKVEVKHATFAIGKLTVSVGAGGLHSVDQARVYYSSREHRLVSVDVASFYPTLIATKKIAPRSYGDTGATIYQSILDRRLAIKKQAKAIEDQGERERLEVQASALKLVLNSAFGKYGDSFSSLFDLGAMLAVTLSGQLMLIDLIERLARVGARVLSANTDGLFIRVARADGNRWRNVLEEWQRDTQMTLDVEPLKRLAILATNRFATLDAKGKIKRKGDGVKGSLSPQAAPNSLVVNDAVVAALLQDIPPERTVRQCQDLVRFCRITRRSKKVRSAVLLNEKTQKETELPKVSRWYRAKGSSQRIIHRFDADRHTTPANAIGIELALELSNGKLPDRLDRGWYIGQARKVIQSVPGYRHRSRKRVNGNAAAVKALDLGLTPVPKWAGKAQLPGADAKVPTLLWEWDRAKTLGCYTGPKVATLVLDIDDPVRFKKWVDQGNSPLLANRWRDLAGCLVSVRGSGTAEEVRIGRARGKLIFQLAGDESHPLARITVNRWKKTRGVEIFYGKGLPSVLGEHPSGEGYRLEGSQIEAPSWLVEGLSPRSDGPKPAPSQNGQRKQSRPESTNDAQHDSEIREVDTAEPDELCKLLGELDPALSRPSIGWRTKDLHDGRAIVVGRCPYRHESGTSGKADLSAGFNSEGIPYVCCVHQSCTTTRRIDRRLKARHARTKGRAIDSPAFEQTEIAKAMVSDLEARRVAFHQAPTGAGKSYSLCQAALIRYRANFPTLIAVPTLRIAYEIRDTLLSLAPDLGQADALALVFGQRPAASEDGAAEERDSEESDGELGEYPIYEWTRIAVCTHAAIGRRGFSKFIRGIWGKLESVKQEEKSRPAFDLIIDEASELIRQCRRQIDLQSRFKTRNNPDRSGGAHVPLRDCPKKTFSGNCANCTLDKTGGELRFNAFGIRELNPPRVIQVDVDGKPLGRPCTPLVVENDVLKLGPTCRVGTTTFAAAIIDWRGKLVNSSSRRTAPVFPFRKDPGGTQPPETVEEVLAHMLEFAFQPVLVWEQPVDIEGNPIAAETLKHRIGTEGRHWDEDIIFPRQTCEVRRLLFADLYVLERLRRFAETQRVGVLFVGAELSPDDMGVLREVWPALIHHQHPYSPRKIKQAAVVFVDGRHGVRSLLDAKKRFVTYELEKFGRGLVFCPTRRAAESLFKDIQISHPSARLAVENVEHMILQKTLHRDENAGCFVTYARGVIGLGANIEGLKFLVIDAEAFRAISGFNPADITPEAFEKARAEERLALILQNIGRVLRGETGKTTVLIVLNADKPLETAIRESRAIIEGTELAPVFTHGDDVVSLVDQSRRWLEANGGDWPAPDPAAKSDKRKGRPRGSPKKNLDYFTDQIEEAIASGMSWGKFSKSCHPERYLNDEDLATLKDEFNFQKQMGAEISA